jgi:hypothetical protein
MAEYKMKTGKIEGAVVGAYKKIEDGVVGAYRKVEDAFVDTFLEKVEDEPEKCAGATKRSSTDS